MTPELPMTDDSARFHALFGTGRLLGWLREGIFVAEGRLEEGEEAALVFDRTCFFAADGGQAGDTGEVSSPAGSFAVADTRREGQAVLHLGRVVAGHVPAGQEATLAVDDRRLEVARNHTAAHLLHFHLSRLPDPPTIAHTHVDAAGLACELVGRSPTAEEIASLEAAVNAHIRSNVPVTGQSLPLALALQVPGIRRPPGPRPADPARIVLIGPANARTATADHPAEFCTGTHLTRTGGIGLFLIAGREPTPAGCRLTAVTGAAALALTHAWRAAAAVPRA